jgi:hypothetical protein
MAEKSSITRVGTYEPFELQVSRGQIAYHRAVTVFGVNPDLDQTEETVWPDGGIVPHPASATVMTVSSGSTDDVNSTGTGAQSLLVEGLDADFREISEVVLLNGQTGVSTTKQYLRINRLSVASAGTGKSNAGRIYIGAGAITAGVPAVIYNLIELGYNASTTAHYTVPAGHTAYFSEGVFTAGQPGGSSEIVGRLVTTPPNGIRYTAAVVAINNGSVNYGFKYPIVIAEKVDISAEAIGVSNNNVVSTMFNMVLIQNADQ